VHLMDDLADSHSLEDWIAHVFDHPIPESRDDIWYYSLDAPDWEDAPEHICQLTAETFERSGQLLARFSDAQLDQGFWYLAILSQSMSSLLDPEVPASVGHRALRSFIPLFEQVMAVRCSPHLSHLDDRGANPLNSACYMWWDILAFHDRLDEPEHAEFDAEVLVVLRRLLAIPHDACRESALHGIGEWASAYPQVADIVDEFLRRTPNLRPELVAYAKCARTGDVL
jgi:hypothetical protein